MKRRALQRLGLALTLLVCGFRGAVAEEAPGPLDIGDRLALFVDTHLIDSMRDVTLKLHTPALASDPEGDIAPLEYGTIIQDGALFRLYTRARHNSTGDGSDGEYTRYFESDDGLRWRAPNLGLFTVEGTDWTNVILHDPPYCHNFSPMLDGRPGVAPEERFKALGGSHESGLAAFVSADGVRWSKLSPEPMIGSEAPWTSRKLYDSQNVSFWSEAEGRYVCYFRTWYEGLRRIGRMTSDDYRTWTNCKLLDVNAEGEHLYTSQTHPYFRAPDVYIALPTRYYPDRGSSTDILFMSARGDAPFERPFHEAYIRPGLDPARWGNRSNYAVLNVVPTGPAEMSIYTTPFRRFTLRTDGFVSIHARATPGELVTKPVRFDGRELVVNYATSAGGSLRVELQDLDGQALPGFSLEACPRQVGDAIEQLVSWEGSPDLDALRGTAVRLRFELLDADLYSLCFRG